MSNINNKVIKIFQMIDDGLYFTISRPRQYGKTTILNALAEYIKTKEEYILINISFEGIDSNKYEKQESFIEELLKIFSEEFIYNGHPEIADILDKSNDGKMRLTDFSRLISEIINKYQDKKFLMFIDEIDKSSNNTLFLDFLAILRDKYLKKQIKKDVSFHSIVLAGLHDIKTLKLKIRPDEQRQYNSPWNIAVDFDVDMTLNKYEIESMLIDYVNEKGVVMNTDSISTKLHLYTSGYPYLVSKLCKIIDEKLYDGKAEKWEENDINEAIKILLMEENNPNFDTIINKLEENREFSDFIRNVGLNYREYSYEISVPFISLGVMYGILGKTPNNKVKIHNKIYEEKLTNYFIGKMEVEENKGFDVVQSIYIKENNRLDMKKVMVKFQEFIKEKYSNSDLLKSDEFLENDLRMLFLAYMKPIINGIGFSFKEVQTSAEKRLDMIVIFLDEKFIIEMKVWRGEEYHLQGIKQLKGYMSRENVKEGYMLIMDKRRSKEFTNYEEDGILMVWV